jgi:hypothetical protein
MCADVRLLEVIVSHEAVRSVVKMQWHGLQAQLVHTKGRDLFFFLTYQRPQTLSLSERFAAMLPATWF